VFFLIKFVFVFIRNCQRVIIESLWIELFPNTKRAVFLCCVYHSPSDYHFYDHLILECEKALLHSCQKLIIIGDLNSDVS